MAKKFTCTKITLDAEVEMIDGTTVKLSVPKALTASEAAELLDTISKSEKEFQNAMEERRKADPNVNYDMSAAMKAIDAHLCAVYGKESGFFCNNMNAGMMRDLKMWVIEELGDAKKK